MFYGCGQEVAKMIRQAGHWLKERGVTKVLAPANPGLFLRFLQYIHSSFKGKPSLSRSKRKSYLIIMKLQ
jgi:hypothetical protein